MAAFARAWGRAARGGGPGAVDQDGLASWALPPCSRETKACARPVVESQLCHLESVWFGVSSLIPLSLSFSFHQLKLAKVPTPIGCLRVKGEGEHESSNLPLVENRFVR